MSSAVRPSSYPRDMKSSAGTFSFVDLFAGIGGFHVALSALGGRCVFASEWNQFAAKTYRAWTGFEGVSTEDIRLLDIEQEIPKHDILCAGFPCQPFSLAGVSKKNALGRPHGFEDLDQGNLFFSIRDIAEIRRPAVLFLENVKNLLRHDRGQTWDVIRGTLDGLKYRASHAVIDAGAWVPQHRERVFIVAFDAKRFLPSEIAAFQFPEPPRRHPRLKTVLEPRPDEKYMLSDSLWNYLQAYAEKHRLKGNGFGFGLASPESVTRTLSARYYKDGSEILVSQEGWRNPRRLTPREATRLMGFSRQYARIAGLRDFPQVVSDVQMYKQLGNSVSPPVVQAIGEEILKVLELRRTRLQRRRASRART